MVLITIVLWFAVDQEMAISEQGMYSRTSDRSMPAHTFYLGTNSGEVPPVQSARLFQPFPATSFGILSDLDAFWIIWFQPDLYLGFRDIPMSQRIRAWGKYTWASATVTKPPHFLALRPTWPTRHRGLSAIRKSCNSLDLSHWKEYKDPILGSKRLLCWPPRSLSIKPCSPKAPMTSTTLWFVKTLVRFLADFIMVSTPSIVETQTSSWPIEYSLRTYMFRCWRPWMTLCMSLWYKPS